MRSSLSVLLEPATQPVFHPTTQAATLLLAGAGPLRRTRCVVRDRAALVTAAQHLHAVTARADDQYETDDAERNDLEDEPDEYECQSDEDPERAQDNCPARSRTGSGRSHGCRELGVVAVQGLLDLIEQLLLVVGERHRALLHVLDRR